MIHELHELLSRAGARIRSLRLWSSLAVCWLFWAAVVWGIAKFVEPESARRPALWAALAGTTLLTALLCWVAARRTGRDARVLARRIEATHPELGAMLLAALETAPSPRFRRLGYLQAAVVRGAVSHGRQHDWGDSVSAGRLRLAKMAHLLALASLVSACVLLVDRTTSEGRAGVVDADVLAPLSTEYELEVLPGNAEIERGTTLLVIAKFRGALPPDAELIVRGGQTARDDAEDATKPATSAAADSENESHRLVRPMTRSLDDPQYVGRVPAVEAPLSYHVRYAGRRSPAYRISVFDYPELVRADARLEFPAYTQLEEKVVEDVRQITAVEGTKLTLSFRLNKDVARARLVDRDGAEIVLTRATPQPQDAEQLTAGQSTYEWSHTLERTQRFKLHLVDAEQRANRLPPEFVINVTPNNPAAIKLAKPGKDVRVSPLEELAVAGEVTDDFGVAAYGLSYALGGAEATELTLAARDMASQAPGALNSANAASPNAKPEKKASVAHLIDFEALHAEPDQLVSYYLWAEDVGPDGQPRRTLSDMYFAEVRHFDEIFREGEQPTEQQQREQQQQQQQAGGAGQQAEELAELQKQIVNATWKLIRRETGAEPTAELPADATAVAEAQQQAIDQLGELAGELSDAQSKKFAEAAAEQMKTALETLTAAAGPDASKLRPAMSAEQTAYQSLLKLRAREFNVTRQNAQQQGQQGQQGAANSASQQQLQQLELDNDENRYETQSRAAAASQENSEQLAESRQVLNRLAELARHQQDLNERLRELQASLEEADTAEERAELERQLKRLRDQQQEILRDAETLDSDMQNSENREQMQQAAEQLGATRSRVQEASEALEEGQVSQALTEGTRAERELSNLRDDFRRQTADRFTEQMRSLRDAGERMDERQQQLAEQLDAMNSQRQRSLRDSGDREKFLEQLREQKRELDETLDAMRDTVAEAEEPEPLLARQLYDAVQQASESRTAEALDVARQLTEAGVANEAGEAMRQAERGVEQLREQIDRAAESVLGDETEALRRADEQLRQLTDALGREIDQARGERPTANQGDPSQQQDGEQTPNPDAEPRQPGQQGQPSGQPGEPGAAGQQAEGRPGQQGQSEGANRPGEGEQQENQGEAGEQPGQGGRQPGGQQPGDLQPGDPQQQGQGQGQGGQQPPGEESQQPQPGQGQQQGQGQGQGQTPAEGETQQQGGGRNPGGQNENAEPSENSDSPSEQGQPGEPSETAEQDGRGAQSGAGQRPGNAGGRNQRGGGGGRGGREGRGALDRIGEFEDAPRAGQEGERFAGGPITGEDFREWSEGMREVEDMLDDPELSAEAARIRDRAEQARVDYVRDGRTPDWNRVVNLVAEPLTELRARINEEISRKESPDALSPIERDAAPAEFAEEVRTYYQRLGSGE